MIGALLGTFALILVAELGDKTQLLVAWLATRHRRIDVLAGVLLGSAAIHLLSAALGGLLGELVPESVTQVTAGHLFLGFGIWALLRGGDEPKEREKRAKWPALGIAATFFVAELGDKTQLAALSRAAQYGSSPDVGPLGAFWAVWIGATLGMLVADGAAILVGSLLVGRVSHRALSVVSGLVFVGFGVYTLMAVFF